MPLTCPFIGLCAHPFLRRLIAALLAMTAAGCMTWNTALDRPETLLANHQEVMVRLTIHGGDRYVLEHPFFVHDSIGGYHRSKSDSLRVLFAVRDVTTIEVQRVSPERTVMLLAAAGATAIAIASSGGSSAPSAPPPPASSSGSGSGGFGIGSCPYVYSWDGSHWRLDSGTFGGAIARAMQRTDVDNLDYAVPRDGVLQLKVANELPETDHVDGLVVLAVDHDRDVAVAPDASGALHTIGMLDAPIAANDFRGADALARVSEADGWNWESSLSDRDTSKTSDLRDGLELAFVRPAGASRAHLVLDGNNSLWSTHLLNEFVRIHGAATQAWYDSLDAQPLLAHAIETRFAQEAFLTVSVRTRSGWTRQGIFGGAGPEAVKRQVAELDLSQVAGDTVFVRIESAPSFWLVDRIAMDFTAERSVSMRYQPVERRMNVRAWPAGSSGTR
ncbi:MAG: hypothetical protein ACHQU1_10550 [Gemmatimonadales bacterium]